MRDTIRKSSNRYAARSIQARRATTAALRRAASRAQAQAALATNRCPQCGRPVRQNLALTGWVQCSQYGAPGFRADPVAAACSWQGFTS